MSDKKHCEGTRKEGIKTTCGAMDDALRGNGGFERQMVLNRKTLERREYIVYSMKNGRKRIPAVVYHCPWCGGTLMEKDKETR